MPKIYDMGPTALLPLRRKACWGIFYPKNPTASAGFEPANLSTKGQHATPRPPKLFTSTHRSIKCHIPDDLNFRQQSRMQHICFQLIPPYLIAYRIFFLQSTVIWPSLSTCEIKPFHLLPCGLESTINILNTLGDHYQIFTASTKNQVDVITHFKE